MGQRNSSDAVDRMVVIIVAASLMFAASIPISNGLEILRNSQASMKWPTTDGIIVRSEMVAAEGKDSAAYHAIIRYNYELGTQSYSSNQVSFGQNGSADLNTVQSLIRRYEKKQKIRVHFNPANPTESVLETGVTWASFKIIGIGLLLFTAGVLGAVGFLFVAPRLRRKRTGTLRHVASSIGFPFIESDESMRQNDLFQLPFFRRGYSSRLRNILRKDNSDGETMLFDYRFRESNGEASKEYEQTVAAFLVHSRNLPIFKLRPGNHLDKIGEFFGQQQINFGSPSEFSKSYRLQGNPEAAIRELFGFDVLQYFSLNPGWWLEGNGKWLITYHLSKRVKPDHLISFVKQSAQISQLLSLYVHPDYPDNTLRPMAPLQ